MAEPGAKPLLDIRDLNVAFDTNRGQVRPVRDSNVAVYPGQTVALVGESGCGKSVTAMSILKLLPMPPAKFLGGSINYNGTDIVTTPEKDMRKIRGGQIAMIFQEPMTSLNPVYTIGDQIVEAIRLHQNVDSKQAWQIAERSLTEVGIADAAKRLVAYPHQMSGGMRQRVMIAMALACEPELLIADEPTTALDVTIQAQILELLRKLQTDRGMSILMITHDLGVVAENADVVYVMYASRIVEAATVEDLFDRPTHPYTRALLKSMPTMGARHVRLETIPGNVPNPANFPTGCKFHTRCPFTRELAAAGKGETVEIVASGEPAVVLKRCTVEEPQTREILPRHWAACHQVDGYDAAPNTRPHIQHKRTAVAEEAVVDGNVLTPYSQGDVAEGQVRP